MANIFTSKQTSVGGISNRPGADNSKTATTKRRATRRAAARRKDKATPALQTIRDAADPQSTIGQLDGASDGTRAMTIQEALKAAGAD